MRDTQYTKLACFFADGEKRTLLQHGNKALTAMSGMQAEHCAKVFGDRSTAYGVVPGVYMEPSGQRDTYIGNVRGLGCRYSNPSCSSCRCPAQGLKVLVKAYFFNTAACMPPDKGLTLVAIAAAGSPRVLKFDFGLEYFGEVMPKTHHMVMLAGCVQVQPRHASWHAMLTLPCKPAMTTLPCKPCHASPVMPAPPCQTY